MKIGIFGGTFDPPHTAHLILASEAHFKLGLDQVLWVLTPNPPHKRGSSTASLEDRLDMLSAAIADNPIFDLSRVEIDRPGPHFAADTMRILTHKYNQAELSYLMGGDSLRDLPTWERPAEFMNFCRRIGVMRRPGDFVDLYELETALPGISRKIHYVDAPLLDISATRIREKIREGKPFRYYLPEDVYNLIQTRGLYFP